MCLMTFWLVVRFGLDLDKSGSNNKILNNMYTTSNKVFRPALHSFFDDAFVKDFFHGHSAVPATNIKETSEKFVIELLAPGRKKEDFNLELKERNLIISAVQKEEVSVEGEKYTKREFKTNAFRREFRLPNTLNVDAISAQYEGGVLFVNLPKLDETKQAELVKKIQVG